MNSKKDLLSLFSLFRRLPRPFSALAGFTVLGALSLLLFYAYFNDDSRQFSNESSPPPALGGLFSESLFSRIFEAEEVPSGQNRKPAEPVPLIPYNNEKRGPLEKSCLARSGRTRQKQEISFVQRKRNVFQGPMTAKIVR